MKETTAGTMLTDKIQSVYLEEIKKLSELEDVEIKAQGRKKESACGAPSFLLETTAETFLNHPRLEEEVFGPSTLLVKAIYDEEILAVADQLKGHLTSSLIATEKDLEEYGELISILENKAGRLVLNGYPTGVEVCHSMQHGGPFPASTDLRTTSVGTAAIMRFVRPVCYQDFPANLLPDELKDDNPLGIWRKVNGTFTK